MTRVRAPATSTSGRKVACRTLRDGGGYRDEREDEDGALAAGEGDQLQLAGLAAPAVAAALRLYESGCHVACGGPLLTASGLGTAFRGVPFEEIERKAVMAVRKVRREAIG